ncbi:AraC-type DNA-binding protein [Lachnospiraceae bacterium KH1T2]|nr:AraC-type DNA-binding protein [Lachnospiraceae bacterium KH1T2]
MNPSVKYTVNSDFRCLEDMSLASMELELVHMGKEKCKPYHAFSGIRTEYIIHFITSGKGFYSVDGVTYPLTAGQMFLICPGNPVVYCSDVNDPWTYMWIGFKGFRSKAILTQCGFEKNRLVLPSPSKEDLQACFNELFDHVVQDYASSLYREAMLLKLLSLLVSTRKQHITDGEENGTPFNKNRHLDLAIEYINTHYMKSISVSDISKHVGISQGYLNQIFTQHANMSIQKYLIEFRMYKAANLLVGSDFSIKEISNMVGYQDQLVFSKAFKKKFEMSPKSYRVYRNALENPIEKYSKKNCLF